MSKNCLTKLDEIFNKYYSDSENKTKLEYELLLYYNILINLESYLDCEEYLEDSDKEVS